MTRRWNGMRLTAEATPAKPKNGAYGGHVDMVCTWYGLGDR